MRLRAAYAAAAGRTQAHRERAGRSARACVELAGELIEGHAVVGERDKQVIHQVGRLVADMVVIAVFAGERDFARLFDHLFSARRPGRPAADGPCSSPQNRLRGESR